MLLFFLLMICFWCWQRGIIYFLWDNFLYMKSSTVSYKQSLQNKGGVKLYTNRYFFVVVSPNLQVVVIIKKGKNVYHEDFDDVKKIKSWIISVIIKENVDHALFWWCRKEITWLTSSKRRRMWIYVYMILMMPKISASQVWSKSRIQKFRK